jgi:hypothetical protein
MPSMAKAWVARISHVKAQIGALVVVPAQRLRREVPRSKVEPLTPTHQTSVGVVGLQTHLKMFRH